MKKKQVKKVKGKIVIKSPSMSLKEKRDVETHQFTQRLNQQKSYFEGFAGRFEGIAEAESHDEQSVRQSEAGHGEQRQETIEPH